jgi:hypothetical protein
MLKKSQLERWLASRPVDPAIPLLKPNAPDEPAASLATPMSKRSAQVDSGAYVSRERKSQSGINSR